MGSRVFEHPTIMPLLATTILTFSCGGKVVVDQDQDSGGGPGTSVGTSSSGGPTSGSGGSSSSLGGGSASGGAGVGGGSGGTGGTSFVCDVEPPPDQQLVYGCFVVNATCPEAGDPNAHDALAFILDFQRCNAACCYGQSVAEVACGPDPSTNPMTSGECCYWAIVEYYQVCDG